MRLYVPILLLALCCPAWAQTPTPPLGPNVIFPEEPTPVPPVPPAPSATVRLPADTLYVIRSSVPCLILASPQGIVSVSSDAGPMKIMAKIWPTNVTRSVKFTEPYLYVVQAQASGMAELIVVPEGTKDAASVTRKLIESQLAPIPPPVPPEPPKPPTPPAPPPNPAPIPVDGFRSLIVYESADLSKLPAGQLAALYSQQVRDYLTSKCTMGPDGKTKEWRTLDKDVVADSKLWQDAMARPRKSLPWIVLSDGKTGFEGPLPATEADLMTLLKKYGG